MEASTLGGVLLLGALVLLPYFLNRGSSGRGGNCCGMHDDRGGRER